MTTETDETMKKRSDAPRKGYQRYSVHLEIEVVKAMKEYAAVNRLKMVDLFNEALKYYLKHGVHGAPLVRRQDSGCMAELPGDAPTKVMTNVTNDTRGVVNKRNGSQVPGVIGLLKRVWKK